jgi:hypothetical protein
MNRYLNAIFKEFLFWEKVTPVHLSLIIALIYLSENGASKMSAIKTSRKVLMKLSKIKSVTTYHKILQDLISMGIITYRASFDPRTRSEISLIIDSTFDKP